jgi:hypothetical protein
VQASAGTGRPAPQRRSMPHAQLDVPLPLITEATSEYYRSIYADADLGPIFRVSGEVSRARTHACTPSTTGRLRC